MIALLYCDGAECRADDEDRYPFSHDAVTAGEARDLARRDGWRRVKRNGKCLDLCPSCYATIRKGGAK